MLLVRSKYQWICSQAPGGNLLGAVVVIGLIIMAALVALLIHSYSDGNLQIPANTLLFIAISGAGLRSFSLPRS
jgi:type III secretory pathway component EscR